MSYISTVDDRGRIRIPKGLLSKGDKVLIIPVGSRIVVIPIPPKPLEAGRSWLKVKVSRKELGKIVEEEALKEVSRKLSDRDVDRD